MNFAAESHVRSLLALSKPELHARMKQTEIDQGFTIVESAKWLDPDDWINPLISQDNRRVRLVLLQARQSHEGSFTKLVDGIFRAGLVPVLVEPNDELVDWCHRHQFRKRRIGRGEFKHVVWYPKRCAY